MPAGIKKLKKTFSDIPGIMIKDLALKTALNLRLCVAAILYFRM